METIKNRHVHPNIIEGFIMKKDCEGNTPLHCALQVPTNFSGKKNTVLVELLLTAFTDNKKLKNFVTQQTYSEGDSALHIACIRFGQTELVKQLLSIFDDDHEKLMEFVMIQNFRGLTVSHGLVMTSFTQEVSRNIKFQDQMLQVLLNAFEESPDGNEKMMKFLNARYEDGKTVLHIATLENKYFVVNRIMKTLRDRLIHPNIIAEYITKQDWQGNTPLHCALCFPTAYYRVKTWKSQVENSPETIHNLITNILLSLSRYDVIQCAILRNFAGITAMHLSAQLPCIGTAMFLFYLFGDDESEYLIEGMARGNSFNDKTAIQFAERSKSEAQRILFIQKYEDALKFQFQKWSNNFQNNLHLQPSKMQRLLFKTHLNTNVKNIIFSFILHWVPDNLY